MHAIFAYFTTDGAAVLDPFPTHIAELSFEMSWFGPTVRHWKLDSVSSNCGTRRDDCAHASIVNHEVANFAYEALADETPEHVRAVVAISGLVESLLGKVVTVTYEFARFAGGARAVMVAAVRPRRIALFPTRSHAVQPSEEGTGQS